MPNRSKVLTDMKWGEIILLWIAGLWTLLLSLILVLDSYYTASDLIWLFLASLPVWIVCGLIWATIYRRSQKSYPHNSNIAEPLKSVSPTAETSKPDKEPLTDNSVIPLRDVRDAAKEVLGQEAKTMVGLSFSSDNWVDVVNAHVSVEELEKLASGEANLSDIQRLISRIGNNLKTADLSTRDALNQLLQMFYRDLLLSGFRGAEKVAVDEITRRTYLLTELEELIEKACFFRGNVKMFRPNTFLDHFRKRKRRYFFKDDLFRDSLDSETEKKIEDYYSKMARKAHLLNEFRYLPFSKAMEAGSLSDVMDGTIQVPLTLRSRLERIGQALNTGVLFAVGVPLFLLLVASPFLLIFQGISYLNYLSRRPWSQWGQLPSIEELLKPFPFLADAAWKITGMKTIVVVGLIVVAFGAWSALHDKWLQWFRPEYCAHCHQRYKTEEAAEQCCLSSPPTRWWIWNHRLITKQQLWKWGLITLLAIVALFILENYWFAPFLGAVFGVSFALFYYGTYKVYKCQEPCAKCGSRATYLTDTGEALCTRCYAKSVHGEEEKPAFA